MPRMRGAALTMVLCLTAPILGNAVCALVCASAEHHAAASTGECAGRESDHGGTRVTAAGTACHDLAAPAAAVVDARSHAGTVAIPTAATTPATLEAARASLLASAPGRDGPDLPPRIQSLRI